MPTICMNCKNILDEIKNIQKGTIDVDSGLEYIKDCIADIQKGGQKLEDRCNEYRNAIESLGFRRIKK